MTILKYWLKIFNEERKYAFVIYKMILNDLQATPNKVNWAGLIRNELFSVHFNDVW